MDRSQIAFDIGVMAYVYSWYEKSLLVICFGKKNVSCKVRNPFHMGLTISHGSYVTKKENGKAPHYKSFCECIVFVNYSTKTNKYVSTVIEIEEMADPTWAECL